MLFLKTKKKQCIIVKRSCLRNSIRKVRGCNSWNVLIKATNNQCIIVTRAHLRKRNIKNNLLEMCCILLFELKTRRLQLSCRKNKSSNSHIIGSIKIILESFTHFMKENNFDWLLMPGNHMRILPNNQFSKIIFQFYDN